MNKILLFSWDNYEVYNTPSWHEEEVIEGLTKSFLYDNPLSDIEREKLNLNYDEVKFYCKQLLDYCKEVGFDMAIYEKDKYDHPIGWGSCYPNSKPINIKVPECWVPAVDMEE